MKANLDIEEQVKILIIQLQSLVEMISISDNPDSIINRINSLDNIISNLITDLPHLQTYKQQAQRLVIIAKQTESNVHSNQLTISKHNQDNELSIELNNDSLTEDLLLKDNEQLKNLESQAQEAALLMNKDIKDTAFANLLKKQLQNQQRLDHKIKSTENLTKFLASDKLRTSNLVKDIEDLDSLSDEKLKEIINQKVSKVQEARILKQASQTNDHTEELAESFLADLFNQTDNLNKIDNITEQDTKPANILMDKNKQEVLSQASSVYKLGQLLNNSDNTNSQEISLTDLGNLRAQTINEQLKNNNLTR